jgi:16S rRNA (adenine(1408)-N(1))-methyltransferase
MADASRRAAGRRDRGGLANIVFLAEGAERLPAAFDGLADRLTVLFPWGSLLRGALGLDATVATTIARLVAPGGSLEIVTSVTERDRPAIGGTGPFGAADIDVMALTYAALGLEVAESRRLSAEEIRATGSTWARRLRSDRERPVWRVSLGADHRSLTGTEGDRSFSSNVAM